uniref:hypothetical protein n=1 Tax=Marinobacterium profundum TaxID=1714300 RepID=UPI00082FBD81|nr:hypothetical protein [Marinobacterium profundum]
MSFLKWFISPPKADSPDGDSLLSVRPGDEASSTVGACGTPGCQHLTEAFPGYRICAARRQRAEQPSLMPPRKSREERGLPPNVIPDIADDSLVIVPLALLKDLTRMADALERIEKLLAPPPPKPLGPMGPPR